MTYHYIYKTTNLINNKIYIGKHSTSNLDDGYLGSGTILSKAIKKYKKENFKKEILEFFKTEERAFEKERELVNEEFILREDTYNLCIGGNSGWFGTVSVRDFDGKTSKVSVNNPKYLSGELSIVTKGQVSAIDRNGKTCSVSKEEFDYNSNLSGVMKNTAVVRDEKGNYLRVSINDSKYISKEFITLNSGRNSIFKGTSLSSETKEKHKRTREKNGTKTGPNKNQFIKITNGSKDVLINKNEDILSGYHIGSQTKDLFIWANNGKLEKKILKTEMIEKGWDEGRLMKGKTRCITNGKINKYILIDDYLPEGFREGHKNEKLWELISPSNELHKFYTKDLYQFCKEQKLQCGVLMRLEGIRVIQTTKFRANKISETTIGWKLCLIK